MKDDPKQMYLTTSFADEIANLSPEAKQRIMSANGRALEGLA